MEMPRAVMEHNPCCLKILQNLVQMKEQPTNIEWESLTRDCHAMTEEGTPIKLKTQGVSTFLYQSTKFFMVKLYIIYEPASI